jgi:hypothetical protein
MMISIEKTMTENPLSAEADRHFTAYSGTTLPNFMTCAKIVDGQVFFDKSKEPKHVNPAFQYVEKLDLAADYAGLRARELHSSPLVLEGELDLKFSGNVELPVEMLFPVEYVYVPKPHAQWSEFDSSRPVTRRTASLPQVNDLYDRKKAIDFLNELKG